MICSTRCVRCLDLLSEECFPLAGIFGNNAASELLRRGQAASMLDMVMHLGDESYRAFSKVPTLSTARDELVVNLVVAWVMAAGALAGKRSALSSPLDVRSCFSRCLIRAPAKEHILCSTSARASDFHCLAADAVARRTAVGPRRHCIQRRERRSVILGVVGRNSGSCTSWGPHSLGFKPRCCSRWLPALLAPRLSINK